MNQISKLKTKTSAAKELISDYSNGSSNLASFQTTPDDIFQQRKMEVRYLLGVGVEQDISQAYKYCSRGAPNDVHCKGNCDPSALNCWGLMYLRGVPYRLQWDVGIFRKAKELGSGDAMYNLGMLKLGWMGEEKVTQPSTL